ncbi:LuxR C-terminal-related transcriptional regulator [Ralstonia syzygii subsp. celebesensis]|uniref:DNA-binding response regulator n=2 Tax=Ralstonia syzygii subsp. celebesensis TaxID=1310168 RepID=A0A1U9VL15_9RALS|nr:response regulator transcription factor [Ralstonia syzygii]AQW30983.1 DNA-binding response regulator [blood disease bacterium A2-HR MARDI]QQV55216.1 response regulator transcription factor [Ralstonia syzygii subsp. celebesensis]CCA81653.1 negative regulator of motility [blood disease bacterium R229]
MLNVLIVEPHDIARTGLRQILKDSRLARQIEAVPNLYGMPGLLDQREWDVMLFSVESATGDEFQTIKAIRQQHARLAVLALGRHPEALLAVRALKAGASGYLPMDATQPQLLAAVNAISKGKKYLPPDLVEVLADNLNVDWDRPRHDVLSDREFQTLRMLGSGRTLGEIAEALQISAKTVSVYRGRVLSKMKLRNNAELTMYVVSNGLQL